MGAFTQLRLERLPNGWRPAFFGDIAAFRIGRTPPRKQKAYWDHPAFPWVSIGDMTPYGTVSRTAESVSDTAHRQVFRGQLVPAGHMLMSFKLTIGRVARLGIPAYHNEAIISFRPDHPDVDEDFLFYYLSQIEFAAYRDKAIKGDTLNKSKLNRLEIALPPLNEQRQIAVVLSAVQSAMERQERLIALTAELKKALMHKLFTEGTRGEPLKQTEIGPVPESWRIEPLVDLLREPLRNGHSAKETPDPTGIRTLTLTAVTRADFSVANTKTTVAVADKVRNLWLRERDIFIQRANTLDYVGLAALYEGPENFAIFPDLLVRVRLREERMLPKVLCEYLIGPRCRRYFRMNAKGTAGNFPKIDQGIIENLQVPVPLPEEQAAIEHAARTLDRKHAAHVTMRTRYEDLFRTVLHQLMTAQVRVQDLDLSALDEARAEPAGVT